MSPPSLVREGIDLPESRFRSIRRPDLVRKSCVEGNIGARWGGPGESD